MHSRTHSQQAYTPPTRTQTDTRTFMQRCKQAHINIHSQPETHKYTKKATYEHTINTEIHRYTNHPWVCNRPRPPDQGSEQGPSQGPERPVQLQEDRTPDCKVGSMLIGLYSVVKRDQREFP